MINAYILENGILQFYEITEKNRLLLQQAVWIDLFIPTQADELLVESIISLNIPTRDDMREIEVSSRLYKEDSTLFMTAPMIVNSESNRPFLDAVSFILTKSQLITIRYFSLQTFSLFSTRINKNELPYSAANIVFIGLLEIAIDRIADTLERVGSSIDTHSQIIFRDEIKLKKTFNFQELLQEIGSNGDLGAKARESLIAFNRIVSYFKQNQKLGLDNDADQRLIALTADIQALSDHVGFLSNQINFLLNANLGMININQSNIIKIFSIAAVIFLPPTLVASVYGMNFKFMPELSWHYGYPYALCTMLASAFIPYQFFKWKKWL